MGENLFNAKEYKLNNGIQLITIQRDTKLASIHVGMKVGAIYEKDNEKGISHFVEHMVFKGTNKRDNNAINQDLEERAGTYSAYTDYRAASGNHTLKIGRIYDSVEDLVLVHSQKNITEAYTWDGEPIDSSRVKELYPESIEIDMERYMSVGDPWWIPGSLGIHFGLTKDHTYEAFLQTREYMMSPEFVMSHVKGFTETLMSLKDRVELILLTNSPQPDSEVILKKLGMEDVFHKKIFNGKKPSLTLDRFNMIKDEFDLEFNEILSVY